MHNSWLWFSKKETGIIHKLSLVLLSRSVLVHVPFFFSRSILKQATLSFLPLCYRNLPPTLHPLSLFFVSTWHDKRREEETVVVPLTTEMAGGRPCCLSFVLACTSVLLLGVFIQGTYTVDHEFMDFDVFECFFFSHVLRIDSRIYWMCACHVGKWRVFLGRCPKTVCLVSLQMQGGV